ncbi:MAG: TRAP transporter substrate-binding protein [Oscillospiraceae bacterium]
MGSKFFEELSRCLGKEQIESLSKEDRRLEIFLHGQPVLSVSPGNEVFMLPSGSKNPEANELYHRVAIAADRVFEYVEAMGASPTPMNSSEVFSALQQGVVDGQENPCSNIYSNKYHEVQKYLTLDGHVFTFVTFVCSKEWFESLTEAEQTAVREGVDIATEYMSQACTAEDEAALEAMIAEGLQVTELTEEAKDGFRAAVADVRERNGNAINPEMYQQMMQAIEAAA